MNILFLTGGLEPGQDGVGDYTRLLAAACKTLGHKVSIVSINDSKLSGIREGGFDGVQYLRISSELGWSQKWKCAEEFANRLNAEWISLQFVPYAFGQRGLFKEFLKGVSKFTQGRHLHFKFHEIWIGQYPKAPLKEKLIGYMQKKMVQQLIQLLQPKVIHYTNAGSKSRLDQAGIHAQYLPIFSNIPVNPKSEENWIIRKLVEEGQPLPDNRADRFIFFGFFGSIHSNWPARQLLERLRMYTAAQAKRPALLHAGILPRNRNRWREMQKNYSGDWLIHSFGKLSDEDVSSYIHGLNYGLTSTPWDLLGKSGAVAAMVEHGLPVIVNVEGGTPGAPLIIQEKFQSLILRADEQLLLKLPSPIRQQPARDNLSIVADQFLVSLEAK